MPDTNIEEEREKTEEKYTGALVRLSKMPEFDILVLALKNQIAARKREIEQPIADPNQIARHNMLIGEINGIELAIGLPKKILAKIEVEKDLKEYYNGKGENDNG